MKKILLIVFLLVSAMLHAQPANWGFSGSAGVVFGNLMPLESYTPEFQKALIPSVQPELSACLMYNDPEKDAFPQLGFAQFGVKYLVPSKQNFDYVSGPNGYYVSKGSITTSAIVFTGSAALVLPLSQNPLNHFYVGYSAGAGMKQYNATDTLRNGFNYIENVVEPGKQKQATFFSGFFLSGVFETERFRYFGMAELGSNFGLPTHIYVALRGGIMLPFGKP